MTLRALSPKRLPLAALLFTSLLGCDPSPLGESEKADARPEPGSPTEALGPVLPSRARLPLPDHLPAMREVEGAAPISVDALAQTPRSLHPSQPMGPDSLKERELPGLRLEGEFRWPDITEPPRSSAQSPRGMATAKKQVALKLTVDVAEMGRMRARVVSKALFLWQGSEIRARSDDYGHLLLSPDGGSYLPLAPGMVRTILGEGRADVTPLLRPQLGASSQGPRRFGMSSHREEITSRAGKLLLDKAKLPEAGEGATLLCRLLTELIAIDPAAAPCSPGELPLRAEWTFATGGSLHFEVTALQHRADIPAAHFQVPPQAASHAPIDLPSEAILFLGGEELAGLRDAPSDTAEAELDDGLVAYNASDLRRYLLLDGVPIASIPPWREVRVPHLRRGKYLAEWRSLFGHALEPATLVEVPGRTATGATTSLKTP